MSRTAPPAPVLLGRVSIVAIAALAVGSGALLTATPAVSAPAPDALVVSQVGVAGGTITKDPQPVSIVTLSSDGSATGAGDVALPTSPVGANRALTLSGTSDAQGSLALSADRRGLSIGGYDVVPTPGFGDPGDAATATTNRVAGWIDSAGTVDTSTVVTGGYDKDNIRSVTSADGSSFYIAGKDTATGIYLESRGSAAATAITSGDKNFRTVGIAGGQLWATSDKTKTVGLSKIGAGLPAASVAKFGASDTPIDTSAVQVGGTAGTPDGFALLDRDDDGTPDTAYVIVETAGIYKYALTGGAWVAEGSIRRRAREPTAC